MSEVAMPLVLVSGYAAVDKPGIYAFTYNPSGALTLIDSYAGILNPSFMALHPAGHTLYATSETGDGQVHALAMNADPWELQPLNMQSSGGAAPCHLALTTDGCWLIASNYSSGTVALLPIDDTGALGAPVDVVQHQGSGPRSDRQEGPHCHSATISPDGRFAVVADLGADELVIYRIDRVAGRLLRHDVIKAAPGSGPRHMTVHPGGRVMYAINELDCSVAAYDYDPSIGSLRHRQTLPTLPPDAPRSDAADIHLSADGSRLYASNRGHNSIAVFDVDADGELGALAVRPCGGDWPRNFALLPGERHMLVANQHSNAVAVLPLDDAHGVGSAVAYYPAPGAACVIVAA